MAKIKISELAIELGCDGKALLSFLQEKGIEAKRSNSSIDDNEAEIARKHFGKKSANDASKEAKPAKTEAPAKGASNQNAQGDAPKKKKKIIMVTNAGNSKMGGYQNQNNNNAGNNQRRDNRNSGNQNNRRGTFAQSQNVYHPIKPLTAPSQLESYGNGSVISKSPVQNNAPAKKEAPVKQENQQVKSKE